MYKVGDLVVLNRYIKGQTTIVRIERVKPYRSTLDDGIVITGYSYLGRDPESSYTVEFGESAILPKETKVLALRLKLGLGRRPMALEIKYPKGSTVYRKFDGALLGKTQQDYYEESIFIYFIDKTGLVDYRYAVDLDIEPPKAFVLAKALGLIEKGRFC